MGELYLIGTNHFDQRGSERLNVLLESIQPDIVATEYSQGRAELFEECEPLFSDPIAKKRVLRNLYHDMPYTNPDTLEAVFLNYPDFEYHVPRDYCNPNGIPLILADPLIELKDIPNILEKNGLFGLSPLEFQERMEEAYDNVPEMTTEQYNSFKDGKRIHQRDIKTAEILRSFTGQRVVYISGLAHIFGGPETYDRNHTLWDRLQDLQPIRIKLNSADQLLTC